MQLGNPILTEYLRIANAITLRTVHVAAFALVLCSEAIARQAVVMINALIGDEAEILPRPAPAIGIGR